MHQPKCKKYMKGTVVIMDIGSRIRNSRIKSNMTQEEFAQKLCVTSQAVSRWECGISLPDTAMIPIIAKTLCISADELLGCEKII